MSISYRFAKMNASAIEALQKFKQYIALNEFEYSSLTNLNRWANEEITKPWEKLPIDESLNQPDTTPYWKRLTKTLLRQIAVGV